MLLLLGGDPSAVDQAGNAALHKAARSNSPQAMKVLLLAGAGQRSTRLALIHV